MKRNLIGLLLVSSFLAACGGGGGGGGGGTTPPPAATTFTVGGSVSGLRGTGLVLQNNGGDAVTVAANGTFTFGTQLAAGATYNVSVRTQPTAKPAELCDVSAGSGSVAGTAVTSISISCRAATGKYVYAVNALNKVSGFSINSSTGALTEIPGSPFSATLPHGARVLHVDPTGKFLYVTGSIDIGGGPSSLTGFVIDSATGGLTPIPGMPLTTPLFFGGAFFSPNGRAIYFSEFDFTSSITYLNPNNGIYGYSIDQATGALTPQAGSPYTFASNPARVGAFNTAGSTVYIPSGFNVGTGRLNAFAVNATTGALTPLGTVDLPVPYLANEVVIHPQGKFAYLRFSTGDLGLVGIENPAAMTPSQVVANVGFGLGSAIVPSGMFAYFLFDGRTLPPGGTTLVPGPGAMHGFSVNATTGALAPLPGSPYPTGGNTSSALVLDPSGRYLAATNFTVGSGTVATYAIDASTGTLTGAVLSPSVGTTPLAVTFDPSGKFAYLPDAIAYSLSSYAISANGTVTFVGSYPVGGSPAALARVAGLQ